MRIGLVLGSGGIVGASYLVGALEALRRLTGWEPAMATRIVGTSAGAYIGTLACAVPTWLMDAHCTGEMPGDVAVEPAHWERADRLDRHNAGAFWQRFPPTLRGARPLLGSPAALREVISQQGPKSWELLATGLIGYGVFSNQSVGTLVREACSGRWPHPQLWITACQLESGRRVVFRPDLDLAVPIDHAVAASTAIPGLFSPVGIRGHHYVDGGVWSQSNADVLAWDDLDVVLAILPLGGREQSGQPAGWLDRFDRWTRRRVMARLQEEIRPLTESGKPVVVLTPTPQDWPSSLWLDHMNIARRPTIIRAARQATMQRLTSDPQLAWLLDALRREAQPARQEVA
jgi:NTE family protein